MTHAAPVPPRRPGATAAARLAGVAAAGIALGVGELVAGLGTHGQSMVGSVGGEVIDQSPGELVRVGIEGLGTADKPVLVATIVVVCLALGALVGPASARRRWVGPTAFALAAALGALAGLRDPLANHVVAVLAPAAAAVAGTVALRALLARVPAPAPPPDVGGAVPVPGRATADRRAFLTATGVVGGLGVVAALGGRALAGRDRDQVATSDIVLPPPSATLPGESTAPLPDGLAVEGISPLVTPNGDFYRIDTALTVPRPDLGGWRLGVRGEVERELSLSYDELLALPQVQVPVTLSCVSNEVGGSLVGNAVWQGVPLRDLLERAGVRPGGEQVVGRSLDGFTAGFPVEAATDGRVALVAVGMNGEALPRAHGFPARLVVEGLYGYVSATKWLSTIELRGWDYDGYWIPLGWAKEGPIKTQSRIDTPRRTPVPAGTVAVAGVAWAPGRGISRVEVQVDDGPWQEADLGPELTDATWRQWVWRWPANPGSHRVRVRATDGTGAVQTEQESRPDPDGATGWHTRTITVEG